MSNDKIEVSRDLLAASLSIPKNNAEFQAQVQVVEELRAVLDAFDALHAQPADATHYWPKQPGSRQWRKQIEGVWHEWCGGQWLHLVHAMEEEYVPVAPLQGAPVRISATATRT